MKILQVVPYFLPAYAFGGPVKVAYQVSRELVKRGHEVVVYTSDARDFGSRLKDSDNCVNGIRVRYFRNLALMLVKKFKLFITPQLVSRAKVEVRKFDIVHLHEFRTFQNIVIAHLAKKCGVPYVLQAHGSLPKIGAWRRLKWLYDVLFGYRLLRDAAKVIALSRVEAEQYRAMGVPEDKIAVIPNGINLSEYVNLPPKGVFKKKFNLLKGKKIILYLGRIHKTKGIDFLVKAYAYLIRKLNLNDTVLVIAGPDDGYLYDAKVLANSLAVSDSILFTGFISNEDKLKALIDAEVFVTPAFHGFPITFLEACAFGVPIITTSLGDTLEWMDGKVGYVTRPRPCDFAEAIYRLISDGKLHSKLSRSCREVVRSNFSLEKTVEKLEKVYEETFNG